MRRLSVLVAPTLHSYVSHAVCRVQPEAVFAVFCLRCACDSDGHYNFRASLERVATMAPDICNMRAQAETETRLLGLYDITLPTLSTPCARDVVVDRPSVSLLQRHSQWLLKQYVPAAVGADGNCLFRAVSLSLYGHEGLHDHLRLLTTIEALLQSGLYDSTSNEYYAPYTADDRLVLSNYAVFVQELVKDGAYSDMLTVLALSSVIQKPIQTRWPIMSRANEASPMTKFVTGRGVDTTNPVDILWTTTTPSEPPVINHFVPLVGLSSAECVSGNQDPTAMDVAGAAENEPDVDDDNHDESSPPPTGQPLDGHFLSNVYCVNILRDDAYEPMYETVPCGLKENVMFKVKVHREKQTCKFWDDCGAWEGTHGKKTFHLPGELTELRTLPDGTYGTRKRVEGKNAVVPLDPQPQQENPRTYSCSFVWFLWRCRGNDRGRTRRPCGRTPAVRAAA